MTTLMQRAWMLLGLGLLFDAFSMQLLYPVPYLDGAGPIKRGLFALGQLVGDIPAIIVAGLVALAIARLAFVPRIDARLVAVCIAIGCVLSGLLIRPVMLAAFYGIY